MTNIRHRTISGEFDLWAPQYPAVIKGLMKRYFDVRYDDLVARLAAEVSAGAPERVLEVGVGTALVASAVARALPASATVHGIDVTPSMLVHARGNVRKFGLEARVELAQAPAERIPYPDASFDVVYSSLCFHHFRGRRALHEQTRVLRRGGLLIILDLGALDVWRTLKGRLYYNFLARMRYLTTPSNRDEFFATFRTRSEWLALLDRAALHDVQISDLSHRTGVVSRERMMHLFTYRSMGTPPLWLITATRAGGVR